MFLSYIFLIRKKVVLSILFLICIDVVLYQRYNNIPDEFYVTYEARVEPSPFGAHLLGYSAYKLDDVKSLLYSDRFVSRVAAFLNRDVNYFEGILVKYDAKSQQIIITNRGSNVESTVLVLNEFIVASEDIVREVVSSELKKDISIYNSIVRKVNSDDYNGYYYFLLDVNELYLNLNDAGEIRYFVDGFKSDVLKVNQHLVMRLLFVSFVYLFFVVLMVVLGFSFSREDK